MSNNGPSEHGAGSTVGPVAVNDEVGVSNGAVSARPVVLSSTGVPYPAPSRNHDRHWLRSDFLAAMAPWFQKEALDDDSVVMAYAVEGTLPGGLPVEVCKVWTWRQQFACHAKELVSSSGWDLETARAAFVRLSVNGVERIRTFDLVAEVDPSMFFYRTRGEMDYVEGLNALTAEKLESWRGGEFLSDDAWVWKKTQLVVDFRYRRKRGNYWTIMVKYECRLRSKHGRPILWQCLATFGLRNKFFARAFCGLTTFWSKIEVPRGMSVELPMVFSYRMRELMYPDSGYWVVAYTEMIVKTAAFFLFDAYGNYRLWALSPHTINAIKTLDLEAALGFRENVAEVRRLCEVVEGTDFSMLPVEWRSSGIGVSLSPGSCGGGADWAYYDPWDRANISARRAGEYSRARRDVPDGHPTGWDCSAPAHGWAARAVETELPRHPPTPAVGVSESYISEHEAERSGSDDYLMSRGVVPVDEQMIGLRAVLRGIGRVPEAVLHSPSVDVITVYLQGGMDGSR